MSFRIIWKDYELGLAPDSVSLAPPTLLWQSAFKKFDELFQQSFADLNIKLHHIGSTSLVQKPEAAIKSKPIIDVLGVVSNLPSIDEARSRFEESGLIWHGENGIAQRRFLTLKSFRGPETFFHIHLFEESSPEIEKHFLFRDYLLAYPEVAHGYQAQKMRLQSLFEYKRDTYTETKASMIHDVIAKAQYWKEAFGSVQ